MQIVKVYNMLLRNTKSGMTLIELIVVITIVGLLAVIGIPSYKTYIVESRRTDGIVSLRKNQLLVENYIHQNSVTPGSSDVAFITTSATGFYTIAYTQVSSSRYKLVATAVSGTSQANDTGCTVITLTSEMDDIYPAACH